MLLAFWCKLTILPPKQLQLKRLITHFMKYWWNIYSSIAWFLVFLGVEFAILWKFPWYRELYCGISWGSKHSYGKCLFCCYRLGNVHYTSYIIENWITYKFNLLRVPICFQLSIWLIKFYYRFVSLCFISLTVDFSFSSALFALLDFV